MENEELQAEQDENAKQLSEYGKKKVTPPKREKKPQKAAASVEKKPKAEKRPREDNFIPWPKAAHKDPVIKALSGDERWTFMGLWSLAWAVKSPNNEMYYGRIRKTRSGPTPRKEIAEELEIPYATLRKHIVKLKKVNLIDTEDGYIRIVDFEAWQGGWRYAENAKDGCSVGNTDVL